MKKLTFVPVAIAALTLAACNTQLTTPVAPASTVKPVSTSVNGSIEIKEPPKEVSTTGSITITPATDADAMNTPATAVESTPGIPALDAAPSNSPDSDTAPIAPIAPTVE